MTNNNVPGLSLAIINDGKVQHHNTFGYANVEQQIPITDQTIFEGASISKSLFAFLVLKYVEEGQLDLDRPLYEYSTYPDLVEDDRHKKITARMVLSHRSGLPNWRENEPGKKLKIKFDPGSNFEYSGEGYQYLAFVLKDLAGGNWKDLEAAFQTKIARPIGMEHTVFIQTPYTREKRAEPYNKNGQWIDWKNNYWYKKDDKVFVAASSIHTETIDFSKWMITFMQEGLLSPTSYQELYSPQSKLSEPSDELQAFYSFGLVSGNQGLQNTYFHSGSNDGFTCFYLLNTQKDWGFVVFTNSEYGDQLGEKIFAYLGGMTL
ncbi:MAG: serine hydrolase domain-containing protein [Saprospiraceae bacterium]